MKTIYVVLDANGRVVDAKDSPIKAKDGLTSLQVDLPETATEFMQNAAVVPGPHEPGAPPEYLRIWMRTKALIAGGGSPQGMYKEVAAFLAALQQQPGWPNPPTTKPHGTSEPPGKPHTGPSKPYVKPHKE